MAASKVTFFCMRRERSGGCARVKQALSNSTISAQHPRLGKRTAYVRIRAYTRHTSNTYNPLTSHGALRGGGAPLAVELVAEQGLRLVGTRAAHGDPARLGERGRDVREQGRDVLGGLGKLTEDEADAAAEGAQRAEHRAVGDAVDLNVDLLRVRLVFVVDVGRPLVHGRRSSPCGRRGGVEIRVGDGPGKRFYVENATDTVGELDGEVRRHVPDAPFDVGEGHERRAVDARAVAGRGVARVAEHDGRLALRSQPRAARGREARGEEQAPRLALGQEPGLPRRVVDLGEQRVVVARSPRLEVEDRLLVGEAKDFGGVDGAWGGHWTLMVPCRSFVKRVDSFVRRPA